MAPAAPEGRLSESPPELPAADATEGAGGGQRRRTELPVEVSPEELGAADAARLRSRAEREPGVSDASQSMAG